MRANLRRFSCTVATVAILATLAVNAAAAANVATTATTASTATTAATAAGSAARPRHDTHDTHATHDTHDTYAAHATREYAPSCNDGNTGSTGNTDRRHDTQDPHTKNHRQDDDTLHDPHANTLHTLDERDERDMDMNQIIRLNHDGSLTLRAPSDHPYHPDHPNHSDHPDTMGMKGTFETSTYHTYHHRSFGEIGDTLRTVGIHARLVNELHDTLVGSTEALMEALQRKMDQNASNGGKGGEEALSGENLIQFESIMEIRTELIRACLTLVGHLVRLARSHKDEWMEGMEGVGGMSGHRANNARDHFHKADMANRAALQYLIRVWNIMDMEDQSSNASDFSIYDKNGVAVRMSEVHLQIADLHHRRDSFNDEGFLSDDDPEDPENFIMAHHHLLQAERWSENALAVLGMDASDSNGKVEAVEEFRRRLRQVKELTKYHSYDGHNMHNAHLPSKDDEALNRIVDAVTKSQTTLAVVQVRMGMLLLDMYEVGYRLDGDGNLSLEYVGSSSTSSSSHHEKHEQHEKNEKNEQQQEKRLVLEALDQLQRGSTRQSQFEELEDEHQRKLDNEYTDYNNYNHYTDYDDYTNYHDYTDSNDYHGYGYNEEEELQHLETLLHKARTHAHMGAAHLHLSQSFEATVHWERSLLFHQQILQRIQQIVLRRSASHHKHDNPHKQHNPHNPHNDERLDILDERVWMDMIPIAKRLWEEYLNVGHMGHMGRMQDAKDTFHKLLVGVRFLKWRVSLDVPLDPRGWEALEEVEEYHLASFRDRTSSSSSSSSSSLFHGAKGASGASGANGDVLMRTLEAHQNKLRSYEDHQQRMHRRGNHVPRDIVYEGSLHSNIGGLHLSLKQIREAKTELELAVNLFRRGWKDTGGVVYTVKNADNIQGEEREIAPYSLSVGLADALLDLSYVYLSLNQFYKSYESFEEAMNIYSTELNEGESVWDHLFPKESRGGADEGGVGDEGDGHLGGGLERREDQHAGWGLDNYSDGEYQQDREGDHQEDEADEFVMSGIYIDIDGYIVSENATSYGTI